MNKLGFINKEFGFKKSFFGWAKLLQNTPAPVSNIKYGRLYNGYAASNPLFAPAGWHVPTQAEYETLVNYLGGDTIAGAKLKESGDTYWNNNIADNSSGFSARGTGYRDMAGIQFGDINEVSGIFSITAFDVEDGVILELYPSEACLVDRYFKKTGCPIRLIKDDSTLVPSLTDLDSNVYRTTKIGNQVWLADNWACTQYYGETPTPIPNVTVAEDWAALETGAYCNYDNDINNVFL
jgi:uncharacterized protein (TIGR02145 family)